MFLYQKYLVMRELTQPVKEGVGEYDPTLTTRSVIASRNTATSHEEPKISMNAVERLKKMKGSETSNDNEMITKANEIEERAAAEEAKAVKELQSVSADAKRKEGDDQHDKAQYYGQETEETEETGPYEWQSTMIRRRRPNETKEDAEKAEAEGIRRYVERTNKGNLSTDEYAKRFEQNKV